MKIESHQMRFLRFLNTVRWIPGAWTHIRIDTYQFRENVLEEKKTWVAMGKKEREKFGHQLQLSQSNQAYLTN